MEGSIQFDLSIFVQVSWNNQHGRSGPLPVIGRVSSFTCKGWNHPSLQSIPFYFRPFCRRYSISPFITIVGAHIVQKDKYLWEGHSPTFQKATVLRPSIRHLLGDRCHWMIRPKMAWRQAGHHPKKTSWRRFFFSREISWSVFSGEFLRILP